MLAALAILWRRIAPAPAPLAQEKALYAGFLADVERRLAAGDLDAQAADEERTAAARALLKAGEAAPGAQVRPGYGYAALALTGVLSLVLYGLFGHPGLKDQPFRARLAEWTHKARTDPDALSPQALALVLRQGRAEHAQDPAYWAFLGRIDMLAGNNYQGAQDYEKARALDPARFDTALILNPRVTETQMLKAILMELGETKLARSQHDLVAQMNRVLLERIERNRDIVLIIDEAQNLSFEVLEQIRLLSNLETDQQKLLQIVLMGQPELKELLAREELRQLRQRILVHYELHPLSVTEVGHYIQHRLSLAGANGRPAFTKWALRAIHRGSGGVPRVVNNLCDRAMLAAFIRESDEVNYWDARRAIRDMKNLTGYS